MSNEEAATDKTIANHVSATNPKMLSSLFNRFEITSDDSFIDFGCGKGMALKVMMQFPFRKITGIELSDVVADIARSNLSRLKGSNVNVVTTDARDFSDLDDYSYMYFYNPFPEKIFQSVLQNIEKSIERHPRRVRLIYYNPVCEKALKNSKYFEIVEELSPSQKNALRLCVYETARHGS
jgi:tRNA1(Val) A37 N6-methylase TrmN6